MTSLRRPVVIGTTLVALAASVWVWTRSSREPEPVSIEQGAPKPSPRASRRAVPTTGAARSPARPASLPSAGGDGEEPSRFPDTEAGRALEQHFRVAEVLGDREERTRAYAESLERLRAHAREAVPILYDAVHELQDAPMEQFTAVKTLADLDSPEAFEALEDIAREPLAPVDEPDRHHKPLLTRDRILRSQAIKGLGRLARSGLETARQALYEIATDPANDQHRSLRFHAVNGFVGTGPGSEARAAAMKPYLPTDLHWLLEPDPNPTPAAPDAG